MWLVVSRCGDGRGGGGDGCVGGNIGPSVIRLNKLSLSAATLFRWSFMLIGYLIFDDDIVALTVSESSECLS